MSVFTYEWAGEPHASESIKRVDGVEVARNYVTNPSFEVEPPDPYNVAHEVEQSSERSRVGSYSARAYDPDDGFDRLGGKWSVTQPGGFCIARIWVYIPSSNGSTAVRARFQWGVGTTKHSYGLKLDQWFLAEVSHDMTETPSSGSFWFGVETDGNAPGDEVWFDAAQIVVAPTEAEALAQVETYFDGDTPTHATTAFKTWHKPVVTHKWAGEPHASESIKYADGIEVARNVIPGFYAWDGDPTIDVHSASHMTVLGRRSDNTSFTQPAPAESFVLYMEARATEVRPIGGGVAAIHLNVETHSAGRTSTFPADGQWYAISVSGNANNTGTDNAINWLVSEYSSPEYEVRRVRIAFDGEEPEPYFDGDTPSYKLDGEWSFVPTVVGMDEQFQHASIKKYADGAYRSP